MVGAGRRCPFPDRLAWIRCRTWSKQRGAKLRGSSRESDGNPKPVVKPVVRDGDVASKHALKLGGSGDDETCSPKIGSGGHDVNLKRVVEVADGGDDGSCSPNMGTYGCDGSPKHVVEVGCGGDISYSTKSGSYGCDWIQKRVVAVEGSSDGTYALKLGSCSHDGSTSLTWAAAMGSNRLVMGGTCAATASDVVDCVWMARDSCTFSTHRLKTVL
jgi:hypothetical protein